MKARDIATRAAELVGGDREVTHGNKLDNFNKIALLWSAWIEAQGFGEIKFTAHDVGMMMVLVKASRTLTGTMNPDDYIDMAGYAACAGEVRQSLIDESWKGKT